MSQICSIAYTPWEDSCTQQERGERGGGAYLCQHFAQAGRPDSFGGSRSARRCRGACCRRCVPLAGIGLCTVPRVRLCGSSAAAVRAFSLLHHRHLVIYHSKHLCSSPHQTFSTHSFTRDILQLPATEAAAISARSAAFVCRQMSSKMTSKLLL